MNKFLRLNMILTLTLNFDTGKNTPGSLRRRCFIKRLGQKILPTGAIEAS